MNGNSIIWRSLWLGLLGTVTLLAVPRAEPQTVIIRPLKKKAEMIPAPLEATQGYAKVTPRLEAVAETKLIMEGLAHTNFRGLERLLTDRPTEVKAWTFARGQALLLAETANLLMLRPPKNQGQAVWFDRAMALRTTTKELAKAVGERDYDRSKAGLLKVAAVCNSLPPVLPGAGGDQTVSTASGGEGEFPTRGIGITGCLARSRQRHNRQSVVLPLAA